MTVIDIDSVCMGTGLGLIFAPSLSCVGSYYLKRRVLMLGLVSSGSSIFAVVFPIVLNYLFGRVGFGSAVRVGEPIFL